MRTTSPEAKKLYGEVAKYIAMGHSVKDAAVEFDRSIASIYAMLSRNGTKKGDIRDDRFIEQKVDDAINHNGSAKKQAKAIKELTPNSPYMGFKEIGEQLGMSTHMALYHYANGMKKIAKFLKDNPDVADEWAALMVEDGRTDEWDLPYGTINQYRW